MSAIEFFGTDRLENEHHERAGEAPNETRSPYESLVRASELNSKYVSMLST